MLKALAVGAVAIGLGLLLAQPVDAEEGSDEPALTELVQVLRDRGVLEEGDYHALIAKAAKRENPKWYDRIEIWGDLRLRYEAFFFFDNPVPGLNHTPDRHRARYRLRLNFNRRDFGRLRQLINDLNRCCGELVATPGPPARVGSPDEG